MREHLRTLIEQTHRSADRDRATALADHNDITTRLSGEVIRLARLAAATHLVESAHLTIADVDVTPANRREISP